MVRKAMYRLSAVVVGVLAGVLVQAAEPLDLIDVTDHGIAGRLTPSSDQVKAAVSSAGGATGLLVTVAAGSEGYPGVGIAPEGNVWDLSPYGHIEGKVTNVGDKGVSVSLRVDEDADWRKDPWNTESIWLNPGASGTVSVIFGYQYGRKPGYKLDPAKVRQVLLFTGKVEEGTRAFRVEFIRAAGPAGETPPVNPDSVRTRPADGIVFGGAAVFEADKQLEAKGGATAEPAPGGMTLVFNGGKAEEVLFKPAIGRWDFTRACEVRVTVTNVGTTPAAPRVFATSDGRDRTQIGRTDGALAPGESAEIVALFEAEKPLLIPSDAAKLHGGPVPGTGTRFRSDKVDAVRIRLGEGDKGALLVASVQAAATPVALPAGTGTRPPVAGDWEMTFSDEFDGTGVDERNWCVYGPNWWGAKSLTHWSRDQLIVSDGTLRIRFEKKAGPHNDTQESGHESPYAGGFLDSYGKWTQRYGYFECRMKLPLADGLWPAFWMMPDRGPDAGEHWRRQDTANGGMEFDIMEHLTRWGPYNYHVAMHWDGYDKEHKSTGAGVYVRPDRDGYLTAGCLWLPGQLVYFANGREICRWESDRVSSVPMCMMFTMPVGGWDNNSLNDDQLPADWVVDYVRAWQRKDLARPEDGYWADPKPWPRAE